MNIFKIKKEERILAISTVLICTALHVLLILSYPTNFFKAGKLGFWSIFYKHFTVSGFDAYSYIFFPTKRFTMSCHAILSSASCCILATGSTNCSWTKPAATAPHISWLSC